MSRQIFTSGTSFDENGLPTGWCPIDHFFYASNESIRKKGHQYYAAELEGDVDSNGDSEAALDFVGGNILITSKRGHWWFKNANRKTNLVEALRKLAHEIEQVPAADPYETKEAEVSDH